MIRAYSNVGEKKVSRLSPETCLLAERYQSGEFGRSLIKLEKLAAADIEKLTPDQQYALAVATIAKIAPLRIVEGEQIVGSASLYEGACHKVPLTEFWSTSHTTIGFDRVLKSGYKGVREQIQERLAGKDLDEKEVGLLEAMLACLDAIKVWHERYVLEVRQRLVSCEGKTKGIYEQILESLMVVPENPPENFRQAVQSLWMMWTFQRLCGNWSGIGRIDKMLGSYLEKDLDEKRITLDEARELLAHFWIKGCEWISASWDLPPSSGDAQFYQNIILSGVDNNGQDVTNEVTYLVLDIVEELHISDFPIAVRVSSRTPERLWRRIAEIQRLGGGIVSIYNEDLVLRSLSRFGYPLDEVRDFTNDGCWEVIIPGKTAFGYYPFDTLAILQETLGLGKENQTTPEVADFESLYDMFRQRLGGVLEKIHDEIDGVFVKGSPSPLLSMFVEGCIERGRGYHDRGAMYNVFAPHAGGLPDTIDSLFVIKKYIFEEKAMSLKAFVEILRQNWQGQETLRNEIQNRYLLYGNDHADSNAMAVRVFEDYVSLAGKVKDRNGVLRPPGISTFGREIQWRSDRTATAFGRLKGEILASNLSPTPGTDCCGPTAVIKSYCSMDFEKLPNGVPLDLKMLPTSLKGERGIQMLIAVMKTFIKLGGWYLQMDVVDSNILRDAQKHPEKYPNLCVRISGWSARFATLDKDWQEMIIRRTQQELRGAGITGGSVAVGKI
jgi:formate C-acetyltransferase